METNAFHTRITRNPGPNRKYLILTGARAGWVMPGNMLLTRAQATRYDPVLLSEVVVPINPTVAVGDMVVPLKMRGSLVTEHRVTEVQGKAIRTEDRRGELFEEWVVIPEEVPAEDRALLLLQIREHLVLAGYEEESRRRGWYQFWKEVNESAGFILRPVPTVMSVRARWRVNRYELANFMQPDRLAEIVEASDEVILSHITTDHTILLPNVAAECRCADHARVHRVGAEVTSGDSYRAIHDILYVGFKTRMELHSVEVRSLNCALGRPIE